VQGGREAVDRQRQARHPGDDAEHDDGGAQDLLAHQQRRYVTGQFVDAVTRLNQPTRGTQQRSHNTAESGASA
jgi:hypothetical protein